MNLPNKIRLMWGRMENFKCVDYFQVEYFQRKNPAGTVQMTPRINRHRRSVEIEERLNISFPSYTGVPFRLPAISAGKRNATPVQS